MIVTVWQYNNGTWNNMEQKQSKYLNMVYEVCQGTCVKGLRQFKLNGKIYRLDFVSMTLIDSNGNVLPMRRLLLKKMSIDAPEFRPIPEIIKMSNHVKMMNPHAVEFVSNPRLQEIVRHIKLDDENIKILSKLIN